MKIKLPVIEVWIDNNHFKYYNRYRTIDFTKLHRDGDLPAYIKRYDDGNLEYERYYKHGKLHRDGDKPAELEYYNYVFNSGNESIMNEVYYKNGLRHRIEEPAIISWSLMSGKRHLSEHYLFGKTYGLYSSEYNEYINFLNLLKEDKSILITELKSDNKIIKEHCNQVMFHNWKD